MQLPEVTTLAAYRGDVVFDLFLFLHILTAIVGFGSTFVWPMLAAKARQLSPQEGYAINHAGFEAAKVLTSPFIYAVGVTGVLLILVSDGLIEFSDTWISIAFLLYIVAICISIFLHLPNLKVMDGLSERLATGQATPGGDGPPAEVVELQARAKKAQMFGGILHLLFFLILLDMIFKPGT
jgi:hypothetical protein